MILSRCLICIYKVPLLYPHYWFSVDPSFEVDLRFPNFTEHPLLRLSQPIECTLEEGELLFVPHGCPHQVENLSPSVAVSGNYIDSSNYTAALQELKIQGWQTLFSWC
eukprot:m.147112 g.147112  ORF g.147112 m.147112 type:complete len:108 (-) comp14983_c0_seq4:90-413(-)